MLDKLVDYGKGAIKKGLNELKNKIAKKVLTNPYVLAGIAITIVVLMIFFIIYGAVGAEAGFDENLNGGMQGTYGTSWEQFLRSVLVHEGGTRVNADGTENKENGQYYKVENDGQGNPTVGHGLCLYSKVDNLYLHTDAFAAYGYDTKKMADNWINDNSSINLVKVTDADEIWKENLTGLYNSIVSSYSNLTQYQCYALTDVKYRRGNIDGFNEKYNSLWTDSENKYGEDVSSESFSMDSLYSFFNNGFTNTLSGVYTRKKDQWLLFKYGYYNQLGEYWQESTTFSGDLYNEDGSVNDEKIKELEDSLERQYNLVEAKRGGNNIGGQYNPENCKRVTGTYLGWSGRMKGKAYMGNNDLAMYQCTWWANGRASEYVGKQIPSGGNGKYVAQNFINAGYGKSIDKNSPQPNSVISYEQGDEYGHVAYIEAVDNVNGYYYISHCGGGKSWFGIWKVKIGEGYSRKASIAAICALEK